MPAAASASPTRPGVSPPSPSTTWTRGAAFPCSRAATAEPDLSSATPTPEAPVAAHARRSSRDFEAFDLVYRSLCALLYNYVPISGHPGGSISSGRFVAGAALRRRWTTTSRTPTATTPTSSPTRPATRRWASTRCGRCATRSRASPHPRCCRRTRRSSCGSRTCSASAATRPPRRRSSRSSGAKALDGHPTPATPFVRLSTGASGVGVAARSASRSARATTTATDAPRVHIVEGEGGLTPGPRRRGARRRRHRLARQRRPPRRLEPGLDRLEPRLPRRRRARATTCSGLRWSCSTSTTGTSIDVPDGTRLPAGPRRAAARPRRSTTASRPRSSTARSRAGSTASRGAPRTARATSSAPTGSTRRSPSRSSRDRRARCRAATPRATAASGAGRGRRSWRSASGTRCCSCARRSRSDSADGRRHGGAARAAARAARRPRRAAPREGAPRVEAVYEPRPRAAEPCPRSSRSTPGTVTTLRAELGRVLGHYNKASRRGAPRGAPPTCSARPASTRSPRASRAASGTPRSNPGSRTLSIGGICEDAMAGILSGLVDLRPPHRRRLVLRGVPRAARPHRGAPARDRATRPRPPPTAPWYRPIILVCAHAGLKTGEDGPTHADPQPLQLLQENFPRGHDDHAHAVGPAGDLAARRRGARRAPGGDRAVRHPPERDGARPRGAGPRPGDGGGAPASTCCAAAADRADGTVVLQESAVDVRLRRARRCRCSRRTGSTSNVYYVASAELFDLLPAARAGERSSPRRTRSEAMGITGFTLPTLYRWVRSDRGRGAHAAPVSARATSWAAARGRWCSPRPGSTARARRRRSGRTWRRGSRSRDGATVPVARGGPRGRRGRGGAPALPGDRRAVRRLARVCNSALYSDFARNHLQYGLGYTRLYCTWGATASPPAAPDRYLNHPPLICLWTALPLAAFGDHECAARSRRSSRLSAPWSC